MISAELILSLTIQRAKWSQYVSVNERTSTTVHAPPTTYGASQPGWNPQPATSYPQGYPISQPPAYSY
ncbi:hypothetical protein CHS0354_015809 [Potamilus streckersoni]|uniref:Uncharacterized protein n=1 Tax=Potamilus streckersoni TaxID=2493646 RepID=A0AAE0SD09_9BIVA|nr:hypothetical protein CHS0354_015809 [Potamilus streckersoni]